MSKIKPEKSLDFLLLTKKRKFENAGIRITKNYSTSDRTLWLDASLFDYVVLKMLEIFITANLSSGELILTTTETDNLWKLNMSLTDVIKEEKSFISFRNRDKNFNFISVFLAIEAIHGELFISEGSDDYGFTITIPRSETNGE